MLSPGEGERDADRWTNTREARSYLSHLATVTADIVVLDAFTAAVEAANAVAFDDTFMRGAIRDYERLVGLHLGAYPQAGPPIDPSPDGPLGRSSAADGVPTNSAVPTESKSAGELGPK